MQLLTTLLVFSLCLIPTLAAAATPHIYDVPQAGPPGSQTQTVGNGWDPNATLDIYLDSTSVGVVNSDNNGTFGMALKAPTIRQNGLTIQIPKDAVPGQHWITAIERITQLQAQVSFTVSGDWPQYHFDAQRTGYNPSENILSPSTVGNLTLRWTYPSQPWTWGGYVVAHGVLFSMNYEDLTALDAGSGTLLWQHVSPPGYGGPPAVIDGVAYVSTCEMGWNALWGLNPSTGDTIWYHPGPCAQSPAIVNGVEYLGSSYNTYAVNTANGETLWESDSLLAGSAAAVSDGLVFVAGWNGTVYAMDAGTGAFVWQFQMSLPMDGDPIVSNGLVYFGGRDQTVYAVKGGTGALVWKYVTGDYVVRAPAIANGVLYVASDKLYAFDAGTGAVLWSAPVHNPGGVTVANGVVYLAQGFDVDAVDAATGALLWNYTTQGGVGPAPVVVNGMVYAASNDGNTYAFGLPQQQMAQKFSPPQRPDPARLTPNWNPPLKK